MFIVGYSLIASALFASFDLHESSFSGGCLDGSRAVRSRATRNEITRVLSARAPQMSPLEQERLAAVIEDASATYVVDPKLVLAVMHVESAFKKGRVSRAGAIGLMQLMPLTAEEFAGVAGVRWRGPNTLYDDVANVRIGVAYLAYLLHRFGGRAQLALTAYCHGPTRVIRSMYFKEERLTEAELRYSAKVMAARREV